MKAKKKHAPNPIKLFWDFICLCYREFKTGLADKDPRYKIEKTRLHKLKPAKIKPLAVKTIPKPIITDNPKGSSQRELLRSELSKYLRKIGLMIHETASKHLDSKTNGPIAVLTNGKPLFWDKEYRRFTIGD
jgi:hypothetical protein